MAGIIFCLRLDPVVPAKCGAAKHGPPSGKWQIPQHGSVVENRRIPCPVDRCGKHRRDGVESFIRRFDDQSLPALGSLFQTSQKSPHRRSGASIDGGLAFLCPEE